MPKRINTRTSARDPPWCKDCDADFAGDCVDAGHRPYSAKMLREDKSASILALLERGVAAGKELSQHTQRFLDAVAREAERNRSSNKLLLDNLQRLRAATADGTAFDTAMQLAKDVVDQVPELERRAALLASGGRLSVALERKTCARLEAHLQLEDGDDLSLARLLLLQLLDGGKLHEVADEVLPSSSGETQLPLPGHDGELDLSRLVKEDIEKLLGDPTRCHQIRKLTCSGSADLAGSLQVAEVSALLAKAKCLKEIHLSRAYLHALKGLSDRTMLRRLDLNFRSSSPEEGDVPVSEDSGHSGHSVVRWVRGTPLPELPQGLTVLHLSACDPDQLRILEGTQANLRELHIQCLHWKSWRLDDGGVFRGFPTTLERLRIEDCSTKYLMLAASPWRLPRLWELALLCTKYTENVKFPPLPLGHGGLRRLEARLFFPDSLQSLVQSHAATLTHLGVHTDRRRHQHGEGFPFHRDLHMWLCAMKLPKLRRLVLHRPAEGHELDDSACKEENIRLRLALHLAVEVLCSVCDSERVH